MSRPTHGYSLIELLVVLAIVGVLALVGATAMGNQRGTAVRSLLDEMEGTVLDAQHYAVMSGRDVALVSWGTAEDRRTLGLARGDAAQPTAAIKAFRDGLVAHPPILPDTDLGMTVAPLFTITQGREHQNSGIAVKGSTAWTTATGINQDLLTIAPFLSDVTAAVTPFSDAFADTANLFQGGSDPSQVVISGASGRFTSSFNIRVVGSTRAGEIVAGGAQGLLVVLNNGATVYKFYNPGRAQGDGKWRRI